VIVKHLPKNTLAHFNAAPQTRIHDFSALPVSVFAEATKKYKSNADHVSPNDEAVTFYTLNHAVSIVNKLFTANEPLPEWARTIMQSYTDVTMAQGERLLHYILCITVREMRHLKSHGTPTPAFWSKVEQDFGHKMQTFLQDVTSHGGEDTAMNRYMNQPPDVDAATYLKAMSYAFHKSPGWSSQNESYGGPKWGEVMDAAMSMLTGVTSMEMLVDTGYTLAHNGGPIFNKGFMYTLQDTNNLMTVLDLQRAGQMLDLMLLDNTFHVKKTPEAVAAVTLLKVHCPVDANDKPIFKGSVDWQLVSDSRPAKEQHDNPNKYAKMIGVKTVTPKKPKTVTPPAPVVTPLTHVHGKKVKVTGEWMVYPNQTITTYERLEK
jgi:hypothetical protein